MTNLQTNTAYDWYLRTYCSSNDQSNWVKGNSFTTSNTLAMDADLIVDQKDNGNNICIALNNLSEGGLDYAVIEKKIDNGNWYDFEKIDKK
ncbi:MAG: hypothetical protein R2771_10370 [Saprospiraceae bacterium]